MVKMCLAAMLRTYEIPTAKSRASCPIPRGTIWLYAGYRPRTLSGKRDLVGRICFSLRYLPSGKQVGCCFERRADIFVRFWQVQYL
jgi:hypothetical protein